MVWGQKSESKEKDKDEMLDTLWGAGFFQETSPSEYGDTERFAEPSTEMPSHMTIDVDPADGSPVLARFTYVDEDTCIGCKNCALTARNTFFMEESFAGKARVFNQGGDDDDLIAEAIETCPVDCIHYVSHEDLVTLEEERISRDDNLDFNNYASFKKGWTGQATAVPETKAKYYGSLAMGTRCNNCPSRGCAMCPMFGVGENPVYKMREQKRSERKERSGQAKRDREELDRRAKINTIYADGDEEGLAGGPSPFDDEAFGSIFGEGYSFESLDESEKAASAPAAASSKMVAGDAESASKDRLREELADDDSIAENLDPYAVLGVKKGADLTEIRRAFRRLAMRWHPDRCAQLSEMEQLQAELIFKQVNLANEVLCDEAKRRAYDAGKSSISELVDGFWANLQARMQGRKMDKGVVVPNDLSLAALAEAEEEDTGVRPAFLLGEAEDP